jgi:hypothetical protein
MIQTCLPCIYCPYHNHRMRYKLEKSKVNYQNKIKNIKTLISDIIPPKTHHEAAVTIQQVCFYTILFQILFMPYSI